MCFCFCLHEEQLILLKCVAKVMVLLSMSVRLAGRKISVENMAPSALLSIELQTQAIAIIAFHDAVVIMTQNLPF